MPGVTDPLSDSLSRSLASIVYSRQEPPPKGWLQSGNSAGNNASSAGGDGASAAAAAPAPQQPQQQQQQRAADREEGALYVSHLTKAFNDRHVWVDGRGNVVNPPETRVIETQKYATLVEKPAKSMEERAREREAFSLELWKKVNPGYLPSAADISQYANEHSFVPADLELAKGREKDWKNHLLKTDTNKYVEAVARAKVFANIDNGKK